MIPRTLIPFLICLGSAFARDVQPLPQDPYFADYQLKPAPEKGALMLETGDLLAICGDSITEQKRYSLIIESYLTACVPELAITCRQFGWSGEQAGGFLTRMENDVLRFKPNIATTCYGMNDFRYVPFNDEIAATYRKNLIDIAAKFKAANCDVLLGSPGIIDSVPSWVQSASGTQKDLNLALSQFRNIGVEVALENQTRFADVYRPMLIADFNAKNTHGPDFKVAGKDGVHPGWAGQIVMAYAFLNGLGLDGDLGSIILDAAHASASNGHEVKSYQDGILTIKSSRFPFSPDPGDLANDDTMSAGLALVPFHQDLNRFTLKMNHPTSSNYSVKWGEESRTYSAEELKNGVNLAADFINHPLLPSFKKIWNAAEQKQRYETRQMKELMHGQEGATDMEATVALTEKVHRKFAEALKRSMQPIEHTIEIKAAE